MSAHAKTFAATVVFAAALAGCGQGGEKADAPPAQAPSALEQNFVVEKMRSASLDAAGDTLTVRRSGDGPVGVNIARVAGATTAAQITFAATGDDVRLRVRQNGADGYVQRARENTIMIGPGGADELMIYSRRGDRVTVSVANIADCSTVQCAPATLRGSE